MSGKSCGCGDFNPSLKFKGPNGQVYALELFNGCEDCGTSVGVIVYCLEEAAAVARQLHELPDLQFSTGGTEYTEAMVKVLDAELLGKKLLELVEEYEVDDPTVVPELVEEGLRDALCDSQAK